MKAKDFLPEGVINMSTLAAKAKQLLASGMTEQQVVQQLVKEGIPQRYAEQAVQAGQMNEDKFGTREKRERRAGSRPERSNADRSKQIHQLHGATGWDVSHLELLRPNELADLHKEHVSKVNEGKVKELSMDLKSMPADEFVAKYKKTKAEVRAEMKSVDEGLDEAGKASRALCTGSKPDKDLGASNLASCKSQGLRARDGEKSHKLGKTAKSRIKVGGHRIKGNKYGGPLPDWS